MVRKAAGAQVTIRCPHCAALDDRDQQICYKCGKELRAKPTISRPLSGAERQARIRDRREAERASYRVALEVIRGTKTIREARKIASDALT